MGQSWQGTMRLILDESIRAAREMLLELAAERGALESRDVYALERCAEKKNRLTAELEKLEQERTMLLDTEGLSKAPDAMATDAGLKEGWEVLLAVLSECQHQNAVNGVIVRRQREQVQHLLGMLRGERQETGTYSASGETIATHSGRMLASA